MDLFSASGPYNLLPHDGVAEYHGPILSAAEADGHLARLLAEVAWVHDTAVILGKTITTRRKVAWYADRPVTYTYSGATRTALPWTDALGPLRQLVEARSGERYNSCLLNLYHDGGEGMAWHSDAERDLVPDGAIGALSLGAERRFGFKHKRTGETLTCLLEHGALLVMKGVTQTHWLHRVPGMKGVRGPRVSLTFRQIRDAV